MIRMGNITVLRTRGTRRVVTAFAVAAAAALVVPTSASAQPLVPMAPADLPAAPADPAALIAQFLPAPGEPLPNLADVEALASFAPAILGAAAGPADVGAAPAADPNCRPMDPSSPSSCTRRSARDAFPTPPIPSEQPSPYRDRPPCRLPDPVQDRPASSSPPSALRPSLRSRQLP